MARMNFKSPSQKADFVKDHPGLAKQMGVSKAATIKARAKKKAK